ncbi:hypothetical protein B0H14DRAFT_2613132 [Mycena olivaceomarginata]|nr:hypothetical protein B0H14DRAFT_2613132 [Mycena olivaceomarginata]
MAPVRDIPECYEEGPDRRVRCKVCTNTKWAAFQRGHIRDHVDSAKHKQAVESLQLRQAGRANIGQQLGVVAAGQGQDILGSGLTLANLRLPNPPLRLRPPAPNISLLLADASGHASLNPPVWCQVVVPPCVRECTHAAGCLPSSVFAAQLLLAGAQARQAGRRLGSLQPAVQDTCSEAEKDMWQEYNSKYKADFSADGELDAAPNPAAEDDALLAEVLADPFDATEVQADSVKSAEWYPYPSKTMLLLDICDNLPRLPVSESLMRTIIWILKQCGASDIPSLDALRKTQKALWSQCGVPTISCTSIQGKNFCINDPRAIIRMVIFSAFLT